MKLHAVSTVLLVAGVALVFAGITSALGVSVAGVVATAAAVGGLLYAGAVWFGGKPSPRDAAVVFTRDLMVAAGEWRGRGLAEMFPPEVGQEIVARCREALDGRGSAFSAAADPEHRTFEAVPIRADDGVVTCGLLLVGSRLPGPVARERLTLAL